MNLAQLQADKERILEIVTVEILQLINVELVTETFTAQLFVEFRFPDGALDPDLRVPSAEFPMGPDGKPTFRPSAKWYIDQIDFNNAQKWSILNKDVFEIGNDIHAKVRFEGTFTANLQLEKFPFDVQLLTFSLAVNCRTNGRTPVALECSHEMMCHTISNEEFHLNEVYFVQERIHVLTGTCGYAPRIFPAVNITMIIERKPGFFLINVFLPVLLFVPLSAMQQFIPVNDLAGRMEFGLSMLFTIVAFKFSIASTLPLISYLTVLDKYLLLAGLVNLLICFESAINWRILSRSAVHRVVDADDVSNVLGTVTFGSLAYDDGDSEAARQSQVVQPSTDSFLRDALRQAVLMDDIFMIVNLVLWALVNAYIARKIWRTRTKKQAEPEAPTAGVQKLRRLKSMASTMTTERLSVKDWISQSRARVSKTKGRVCKQRKGSRESKGQSMSTATPSMLIPHIAYAEASNSISSNPQAAT